MAIRLEMSIMAENLPGLLTEIVTDLVYAILPLDNNFREPFFGFVQLGIFSIIEGSFCFILLMTRSEFRFQVAISLSVGSPL